MDWNRKLKQASIDGDLETIKTCKKCGADGWTISVVEGAKNNHLDVVKFAIENGADSNLAYFPAKFNENVEIMDYLKNIVKHNKPTVKNFKNACKNRDIDYLNTIINNGTKMKEDWNLQNGDECSPVSIIMIIMRDASLEGDLELLIFMNNNFRNIFLPQQMYGLIDFGITETIHFEIVKYLVEIIEIKVSNSVIRKRIDINNAYKYEGHTQLGKRCKCKKGCRHGKIEYNNDENNYYIVKYLIDNCDKPLHYNKLMELAKAYKSKRIALYLLRHGASEIEYINKYTKEVFGENLINGVDYDYETQSARTRQCIKFSDPINNGKRTLEEQILEKQRRKNYIDKRTLKRGRKMKNVSEKVKWRNDEWIKKIIMEQIILGRLVVDRCLDIGGDFCRILDDYF